MLTELAGELAGHPPQQERLTKPLVSIAQGLVGQTCEQVGSNILPCKRATNFTKPVLRQNGMLRSFHIHSSDCVQESWRATDREVEQCASTSILENDHEKNNANFGSCFVRFVCFRSWRRLSEELGRASRTPTSARAVNETPRQYRPRIGGANMRTGGFQHSALQKSNQLHQAGFGIANRTPTRTERNNESCENAPVPRCLSLMV